MTPGKASRLHEHLALDQTTESVGDIPEHWRMRGCPASGSAGRGCHAEGRRLYRCPPLGVPPVDDPSNAAVPRRRLVRESAPARSSQVPSLKRRPPGRWTCIRVTARGPVPHRGRAAVERESDGCTTTAAPLRAWETCLAGPAVVVRTQVFHLSLVPRAVRFVPEGERGTDVLELATCEAVAALFRVDLVDAGSIQSENLRLP